MKTPKIGTKPATFQDLIFTLQHYWSERGCVILQPYDMEVGAGTFHTATFLRADRARSPGAPPMCSPRAGRPTAATAHNPFRLQHYYQFQVLIKPSPPDLQELYLDSLRALGFDPRVHDVRFVEDNWESPTLGAWGLGWEVWLNGMEITQFTYFQQVGGLDCRPVTGEITYGLERLAMYLQGVESIFDIVWTDGPRGRVSYGDVFHQNEVEQSTYNFELRRHRGAAATLRRARAAPATTLLAAQLPLPAYEQVLKASHTFNLLDARARDLGHRARALHPARAHAGARRSRRPTTPAAKHSAFRCCKAPARSRSAHECAADDAQTVARTRARAARSAGRARHRGAAAEGAAHARAGVRRGLAHAR